MKKLLIASLLLLSSFNFFSQNTKINYEADWQEVYNDELKDLPKSAFIKVEKIYAKAKLNNNTSQLVKSLIYKSKFTLTLEEDAQLKIVQQLHQEIKESSFPTTNILESVLADVYWQYFKNNRYKFYKRTKTKDGLKSIDFRTWDPQTMFRTIGQHYENSLIHPSKLKTQDLTNFNEILILKDSKDYRPTLFDFLTHRAILFFKNDEQYLSNSKYQFELTNEQLLGTNQEFLATKKIISDSISNKYRALVLFQELTKFHQNDEEPMALIDVTLKRFRFVKANAAFNNKDSLYEKALIDLQQQYNNNKASTEITYNLAKYYNELASNYNINKGELNRFKHAEAAKICKAAIKKHPKSNGAKKCNNLLTQIEFGSYSITSEQFIPTNTHSRLIIAYKNTPQLYFSAYKLTKEHLDQSSIYTSDSLRIAFLNNLEPAIKWNVSLRDEKDYRKHTTEVIVPSLEHGNYVILASEFENITNHKMRYSFNELQVTDFTLINSEVDGVNTYQVVHRQTGKPIQNAEATLVSETAYDEYKKIKKRFTTDKNGQFTFKNKKAHTEVNVEVTVNGNTSYFGNYYFSKRSKKSAYDEEEEYYQIQPFLFTDRSIYRPGQIIYFKAIVLKKKREQSEVFPNEYVEIYLEDPNGEEIAVYDLKLNEFGSVSGEFKIPTGGLTGEYGIYLDESYEYDSEFYDEADYDFDYLEKSISVEEYKRPKFETKFKPIEKAYQLNDSVTVTGNATAFAGSTISNAKVKYRVQRTTNYPVWRNWNSNYYSPSLEVSHGELTTDAKGNYEITFKAIPDLKVPEEDQPTFNYKISADVTDINGETRSAETTVKVGYHTLIATISVPNKMDKTNAENNIEITTTNLNDAHIGNKGVLKIYKLKSPNNPLRKRPWNAPDYQDITEVEFRKLFPNDPYTKDELNESNWKKGDLVFETEFDTENSKEVLLPNTNNFISGKYLVEIECIDNFNQKVKDSKRFSIFGPTEKSIPDNKLFYIKTDKTTYQPNDTITLSVGSASKDLTVTVNVEKNYKVVHSYFIHLNDETKSINIPVTKNDLGGFSVKYHYVNYNGFNSGKQNIFVPYTTKDHLEIETLTFRDKLQPGSEQTWSFKLTGAQKEKVAVEVLASMYDESLDEFKTHNWSFNPITRYPYNSYQTTSSPGFGTDSFTNRNQSYSFNFNYTAQQYDQLNWFGFTMNNSAYYKKRYVAKLASQQKMNLSNGGRTNYDKTITGVVQDDSGPLPGVTILIKGTSRGTATDFDGRYTINVRTGDELEFSFVGYVNTTATVGKKSEISLSLEAEANSLDEVVVTAYGISREKKSLGYSVSSVEYEAIREDSDLGTMLAGKVAGVSISNNNGSSGSNANFFIRGAASIKGDNKPLYVVDGVIVAEFDVGSSDVSSLSVLKNDAATALYGARAANGVILINTKTGQAKIDEELSKVKARKNLQETAFFFPHLRTDKDGVVQFEFTTPEALTRWKMQLLAHSKSLQTAVKSFTTVTQKDLMVLPNPPRFLREEDEIKFSSKISNLTTNTLNGFAQLHLTDAITGKDITNELLHNSVKNVSFTIDAKGNTSVSWVLKIPKHKVQAVQYKIVAKAGDFSDGEQNVLPVLSNRMLVTESLPMWVNSNESRTFTLDKLKENSSKTAVNHKLTLEITSNPAWYAVQSLPYLMVYPYECAEQTFSKYYANSLATHIVNQNPNIKEIFKEWQSSKALISNLEKNEELKSILIQETPWVRDAQDERTRKKRIAMLFDLEKTNEQLDNMTRKLSQMQFKNGGFPWFGGNRYANRYITQHIAAGYGHLSKLGVELDKKSTKIANKTLSFLDAKLIEDYDDVLSTALSIKKDTIKGGANKAKEFLEEKHINYIQLHYLYTRSFYPNIEIDKELAAAILYYTTQAKKHWLQFNLYGKTMIAMVQHRANDSEFANEILASLKENSIVSDEFGRYWKENEAGYYYYNAPIETHALLIETFIEIENDSKTIEQLKTWLLKSKQSNQWSTTKATTEAVYALLLQGSSWLTNDNFVDVSIGNKEIKPLQLEGTKLEAGTGYFKTSFSREDINPEMATVTLKKKDSGIAWGSLYWQYFEDLDQITTAESPLQLEKKIFKKDYTNNGEELISLDSLNTLKIGKTLTVRITLKVNRPMEFVHMKDMRASGLEPISVLSEHKYQDGLSYYEVTKDASTNFFFDKLPKGVFVFEYDLRVNNTGSFSNGITTIQSMYAPEFSNHSEGIRIKIIN